MNDLVVITGQTATGKTRLALDYAKRLDGELINADSRQVYRHLDIVTGKDKIEINKARIIAHLLDVVKPEQPFSSYAFDGLAKPIIQDIWSRGKTPIIVGGSYLYIKHLLYGQSIAVPPNEVLRKKLEKKSVIELQKTLLHYYIKMKSEPKMNHSDWNNPRRLIRKIEILSNPNKLAEPGNPEPSNPGGRLGSNRGIKSFIKNGMFVFIGLKHRDKESLLRAVTERVEKRLKQGAIDEVRKLLKNGYKKTDHGLQTIGYKQLIAHLEGETTIEEAQRDWINKEIQYAKRQLTFMNLDSNIEWIEV